MLCLSGGRLWEACCMYDVGDKVVYPQHGAGVVVARETKTVLGTEREYLTIKILASDMTVMVPADGVEAAGVRPVITPEELEQVLAALRGDDEAVGGNWNRRFKHNRERMRTGDIEELVGVIRNLTGRVRDKPLSAGERQMLSRAKRILASEIQYVKDIDEAEAHQYLDEMLEEIALERASSSSRAGK
jgi:CarD family transcriptional regulator